MKSFFQSRLARLAIALLSSVTPVEAGDADQAIARVTEYVLNENYPELFDNKPYRIKVEHIFASDIDNDGSKEVVMHTIPHFRQSPTIMFFEVAESQVRQVAEGLAPGPLQPVSGQFLDSHTLGQGVDFSVEDQTPEKIGKIVPVARQRFGGVVAYDDFLHVDGRAGKNVFVDMRGMDVPADADSCADFEFSLPEFVTSGRFQPDGDVHLLAIVEGNAYFYRIRNFLADGRIDKAVTIRPLPDDFHEMSSLPDEVFRYRDVDGDEHAFDALTARTAMIGTRP